MWSIESCYVATYCWFQQIEIFYKLKEFQLIQFRWDQWNRLLPSHEFKWQVSLSHIFSSAIFCSVRRRIRSFNFSISFYEACFISCWQICRYSTQTHTHAHIDTTWQIAWYSAKIFYALFVPAFHFIFSHIYIFSLVLSRQNCQKIDSP